MPPNDARLDVYYVRLTIKDEVIDWCKDNFGDAGRWYRDVDFFSAIFWIRSDHDSLLFKLRWQEELIFRRS